MAGNRHGTPAFGLAALRRLWRWLHRHQHQLHRHLPQLVLQHRQVGIELPRPPAEPDRQLTPLQLLTIQSPREGKDHLVTGRQLADQAAHLFRLPPALFLFLLILQAGIPRWDRITQLQGILIVDVGMEAGDGFAIGDHLLEHPAADTQLCREFIPRRIAVQLQLQPAGDGSEPAEVLTMATGDGDHTAMEINPAAYCLTDPPIGIGGEAIAAGGIKAFDGGDQAEVGGLDQVIS